MENGKTIKHMDMVFTITLMVPDTKDSGLKINNTEKVRRFGQMVLVMRASTKMERSTVTESSFGLTDQLTPVTSLITTFMVQASTPGLMVDNITVNGLTIKCTELGSSPGTMAEDMKVSTSTTKNKAKECLPGLTVENMTVSGKMESSTVLWILRRL